MGGKQNKSRNKVQQLFEGKINRLSISFPPRKMVSSKRNSTNSNPNPTTNIASSSNSIENNCASVTIAMKGSTAISSSSTTSAATRTVIMNEKKDKHLEEDGDTCFKYKEGERVLCFEPDPTKVRVIYDAKILQISVAPDDKRSKGSHEFLVHFQGWNASWDRFVPQSYLLKDNHENRGLQKTLFEKAELLSKSK